MFSIVSLTASGWPFPFSEGASYVKLKCFEVIIVYVNPSALKHQKMLSPKF